MSDQTPDPHDDVLRAALEADAEDVVAGPELLDRIRTTAATPSRRHLAPWLLVAAALVAVVGIGAVLLRDDDQAVDSSNDPSSTTSSSTTTSTTQAEPDLTNVLAIAVDCEPGEALDLTVYMRPDASAADVQAMGQALADDARVSSARYLDHDAVVEAVTAFDDQGLDPALTAAIPSAFLVDLADDADETAVRGDVADRSGVYGLFDVGCLTDPSRPTVVALVREDGWLVTVDLATSEMRELHFGGDPNASSDVEEGGPTFVDGVDLSPDGRWVYFSTCCEPANGITYRVPVGGGEVEQVAMGRYPKVSTDGRFVATSAGTTIVVTPTPGVDGEPATRETGGFASQLAWSPVESTLAAVIGTGTGTEIPNVHLFEWDGTTITSDGAEPANAGWFVSWTPDGTLSISSGVPIEDDRSLSQDGTYGWLLWVDEAGVVREQAGHESGDRPPIEGLPEALVADW